MVRENAFATFPLLFDALTVKLAVPAVLGIPEIMPVLASRDKPFGSAPLSRLHVMGAVPVAVNVWLYAVPTVPFGKSVAAIAGAVPLGGIGSKFAVTVTALAGEGVKRRRLSNSNLRPVHFPFLFLNCSDSEVQMLRHLKHIAFKNTMWSR
jgi:hypothetical protein